jgi:hypothetical protein
VAQVSILLNVICFPGISRSFHGGATPLACLHLIFQDHF